MNENDVIKLVLDELTKRGFINNYDISFKNTESLLYSYNKLKKNIEIRKEQIKDLETEGLPGRSPSIILNKPKTNYNLNDPVDVAINDINKQIKSTQAIIDYIDKVLKEFEKDPYFDIIRLKYFEGKKNEEIAEFFDTKLKKKDKITATSTITKNKNRLIKEIRIMLIDELNLTKEISWKFTDYSQGNISIL